MITIVWNTPAGTSGRYRILYFGDHRDGAGSIRGVSGSTAAFDVRP